MFEQGANIIQQLEQLARHSNEMIKITKSYLNKRQLQTGKSPIGEEEITQMINLLQILTEAVLDV